MGYYVQTPNAFGKASDMITAAGRGGRMNKMPTSYDAIPNGLALVVVYHNARYEAAHFIHNAEEFERVQAWLPNETRPHEFVLIDRQLAVQWSGYDDKEETA